MDEEFSPESESYVDTDTHKDDETRDLLSGLYNSPSEDDEVVNSEAPECFQSPSVDSHEQESSSELSDCTSSGGESCDSLESLSEMLWSPPSMHPPYANMDLPAKESRKKSFIHHLQSEITGLSLQAKIHYLTEKKKELEDASIQEGTSASIRDKLIILNDALKQYQEENEKSLKIFNEAMKAGKVPLKMTNALILGEAGVGKSSTKHILCSQSPPRIRHSTPLANPPLQFEIDSDTTKTDNNNATCTYSRKRTCTSTNVDHEPPASKKVRVVTGDKIMVQSPGVEWKLIDQQKLKNLIADVILAIAKEKGLSCEENQPATDSDSLSEPSMRTRNEQQPQPDDGNGIIKPTNSMNKKLSEDPSHQSLSSSVENLSQQSVSSITIDELQQVAASVHDEMIELVNGPSSTLSVDDFEKGTQEILGSNWIYFIDSGGQPHFHNLLPHFIRGLSVVLFALRLSEPLDSHPMVEYYEEGELISQPYRSPLTTEDTFKFLTQSIQSHCVGSEKPKLIIVGTFLDKIQECSESLEAKNNRLLEILTPEFTDQLVFSNEAMDDVIFPINAREPGLDEQLIAGLIRSEVESAPSIAVVVPIWWYVLEIALQKLSAHSKRMVLSKQDCLDVAQHFNISEEALVEALKFFNEHYIFHYYPDILPDVVFTSTQVLLDKLTELVKEASFMRQVALEAKMTNRKTYRACRSGTWQKFRDQGILSLNFLQQFPQHYIDGLFSPCDLMKIFIKQLIVAPSPIEKTGSSSLNQYLMPSLLDRLPLDEVETHRVPCPVLLRFSNGWPRAGVFCCLQVYLIQHLKWKLVPEYRGRPKLIAQNCVMLAPPKRACTVTLIDSFAYIEVHVKAKHQRSCFQICKDICHGIHISCQKLRYSDERVELAFFCPCDQNSSEDGLPQRHPAELVESDSCLKCTLDETVFTEITSEHKIWLTKDDCSTPRTVLQPAKDGLLSKYQLTNEDLNKECSDEQLLKISRQLEKWKEVAVILRFTSAEIEAIRHDGHDTAERRHLLLKKWKQRHPLNATYKVLLEALLECDCLESAAHLCEVLKEAITANQD